MGDMSINSNEPSPELKMQIKELALNSGFTMNIDKSNCLIARDAIIYSMVIDKRKAILDSMRTGFKKSLVFQFLKQRQHLIQNVFPKEADFLIPSDWVISKVVISESSTYPHIEEAIIQFIRDQEQSNNYVYN